MTSPSHDMASGDVYRAVTEEEQSFIQPHCQNAILFYYDPDRPATPVSPCTDR